jgi:hypothetical protein
MSNVSPAWSRDIQSIEGSLIALARTIIHRESIASGLEARNERLGETAESTEEGELLCLVLAIITSAVLADERLASVLASLGKLQGARPGLSLRLALGSECRGQQTCFRSCKCPTAEPFVNELARLYDSFQQPDASDVSPSPASVALLTTSRRQRS